MRGQRAEFVPEYDLNSLLHKVFRTACIAKTAASPAAQLQRVSYIVRSLDIVIYLNAFNDIASPTRPEITVSSVERIAVSSSPEIAVIGVGLHPFARYEDRSALEMGALAIGRALRDSVTLPPGGRLRDGRNRPRRRRRRHPLHMMVRSREAALPSRSNPADGFARMVPGQGERLHLLHHTGGSR